MQQNNNKVHNVDNIMFELTIKGNAKAWSILEERYLNTNLLIHIFIKRFSESSKLNK